MMWLNERWTRGAANNTRPPRASRKTWKASDADHIPKGRAVLVLVDPMKLHPSLQALYNLAPFIGDVTIPKGTTRATVQWRWVEGDYFVKLDTSPLRITIARKDLLYPVPGNVAPMGRP